MANDHGLSFSGPAHAQVPLPSLLLLLSGCILDYGKCTYQNRFLELAGPLGGSAQKPGSAPSDVLVRLAEQKEGLNFRVLSVYVHTQEAVAVSQVQLLAASGAGPQVVYTFPPGGGMGNTWSVNAELGRDTLTFDYLLFAANRGELSVSVELGVAGNLGELSGRLGIRTGEGWHRPYCD